MRLRAWQPSAVTGFTTLARRQIPVSVAAPWVLLALLSPLWAMYAYKAEAVVGHALQFSMVAHTAVARSKLNDDFLVFWPVGKLILAGHSARIYDVPWFSAWQAAHVGPGINHHLQYFYPPPNLLVVVLAGLLRFMPALIVWNLSLSVAGVWLLRCARVPWIVIVVSLASVASLFNVMCAQFGFLTGALFIAGLVAVDRSPVLAGTVFGSLVIKPQAGLLGPIVLLARGRYRALLVGGGMVLALCVAVTLLCGVAIWPAYFGPGLATAHRILDAPFPNSYEVLGASVFWMVRSFGGSVALAEVVQAVCATGAVIICFKAWRRAGTDRLALVALTVTLTLLVTPYGYITDLNGFSVMVVWLAWERGRLALADVVMWLWPALCGVISVGAHAELTPLVLLLGAMRAWRGLGGFGAAVKVGGRTDRGAQLV